MAGFWIPWEHGLTRKREILLIAKRQQVTPREAAACCMEVWEWAQQQSLDGLIEGFEPCDVSAAVSIPGIGEAMIAAGWLVRGFGNVQFPNWERFNAKSAKSRLMNAERQRRYKSNAKVTER